jgi:superfamily II DNA/RNA helicase
MARTTPVNEGDFHQLGLSTPILAVIKELGYEAPTPIQAKTIPPLLAGRRKRSLTSVTFVHLTPASRRPQADRCKQR